MPGRPSRLTVDYFPHFIHHKRTMTVIEDRYGVAGYAAWFKLLELLGDTDGHSYDSSTPINANYLSAKIAMQGNICDGFIELLADLEAIDRDLWCHDHVIWCEHFVHNLAPVYRKRKMELPVKPNFRAGNTSTQPISAPENTQRRVKESKEKERTSTPTPSPKANGKEIHLEYVLLTPDEYTRLLTDFGKNDLDTMIDVLNNYLGQSKKNQKKYTSHNHVLRGWVRERLVEKGGLQHVNECATTKEKWGL
jgi:hypothetical protein